MFIELMLQPDKIWGLQILKSNKFVANICKICKFVTNFVIILDFFVIY